MSYEKLQKAWIIKNNVKVGSSVVVTCKCMSNESGWGDTWTESMNEFIGEVCTIKHISSESGVQLTMEGEPYCFYFPYFVLGVLK